MGMDIELLVANNIGQSEFKINLKLPLPDPNNNPSNQGPTTITIVIIVLACLVVIIICSGVGVFYCHKNGVLCFKTTESFQLSVELKDNHGNNSNVQMLSSKDEVDFFDLGDEVRINA